MSDASQTKKEQTPSQKFYKDYSNLMLEVKNLSKNKENPFFKSSYVSLKDVLGEAKNVCLSNNFIFIQYQDIEEDKLILVTKLIHQAGEVIKSKIELVSKDSTDPQKLGSSITYMRRYSLVTILGIQEEDDDGNVGSGNKETPKANAYSNTKCCAKYPSCSHPQKVAPKVKTKTVVNPKVAPFPDNSNEGPY